MKLFTQLWNPEGQKTALLIHGIGSDSTTWNKVAEYLVKNNYKVIAPDLGGHGNSERASRYDIQSWVNDILDSVNDKIDLIIGHSLGGLLATAVASKLNPENVVLIDPALTLPRTVFVSVVSKMVLLNLIDRTTPDKIKKGRVNLTEQEVEIEMNAIRSWDRKTVYGLDAKQCQQIMAIFFINNLSKVMIVKPTNSVLINRAVTQKLHNMGVRFVNLPRIGHNIHRTHYETFINAIQDFIEVTSFLPASVV